MKTFVIIVTYNGMRWLEKTLASIPKQYRVIVVDNASTDETCQFIQWNYPEIVLLSQETNLGFGQGNNLGISYALGENADAVFLLNQDAYLEDNAIAILETCSNKYPEYGILSPLHFNGKGDALDRNFSLYVSYDRQPHFYSDAIKKKLNEVYCVPFVNAAAWYLPKHTLEILGGFDPIFFHYGEDDNYVQRLIYHGLKLGVVPKATIYHDREDREIKALTTFSLAYFKHKEKAFKVKFGNVNLKNLNYNVKRYMRAISKSVVKCFLSFKWNSAFNHIKERKYTKRWLFEVNKSREMNRTKGKHYL